MEWRLKRSHWGNGYAIETVWEILEHTFNTVDLKKIVADIHYSNRGSSRVAEKIGFKVEDANAAESGDGYV